MKKIKFCEIKTTRIHQFKVQSHDRQKHPKPFEPLLLFTYRPPTLGTKVYYNHPPETPLPPESKPHHHKQHHPIPPLLNPQSCQIRILTNPPPPPFSSTLKAHFSPSHHPQTQELRCDAMRYATQSRKNRFACRAKKPLHITQTPREKKLSQSSSSVQKRSAGTIVSDQIRYIARTQHSHNASEHIVHVKKKNPTQGNAQTTTKGTSRQRGFRAPPSFLLHHHHHHHHHSPTKSAIPQILDNRTVSQFATAGLWDRELHRRFRAW